MKANCTLRRIVLIHNRLSAGRVVLWLDYTYKSPRRLYHALRTKLLFYRILETISDFIKIMYSFFKIIWYNTEFIRPQDRNKDFSNRIAVDWNFFSDIKLAALQDWYFFCKAVCFVSCRYMYVHIDKLLIVNVQNQKTGTNLHKGLIAKSFLFHASFGWRWKDQ